MAYLVGLAVGLGLVFGCLMLALAAEFYYLLCWRNRAPKRDVEEECDVSSRHGAYVLKLNCLKKPTVLNSHATVSAIPVSAVKVQDTEFGIVKEAPSASISDDDEEIGLDTELMKLHGLAGPPRFLFTIKEESREDLTDSDDNRSRSRSRSMNDVMVSHSDFEFDFPVKSSSPPPKFKFLRDAEEKFYWKQKFDKPAGSSQVIPLPLMDEKLSSSVHIDPIESF